MGDRGPDDATGEHDGPDGAGEQPGGDEQALRARVSELEAQVTELDRRWREAAADLANARKRHERDAQRSREVERARVASDWLPVLDNLDVALEHAQADPASIVEGVRAVRDQAVGVLGRLGFPRRGDEAGTAFDPNRHEAVTAVPAGDQPPGTVVQVVRPGYGEGDQQLRPSSVVVARDAQ